MDINKLKTRPAASDQPVYSLQDAAKLLEIHPQTLRKYLDAKLVRPVRQGPSWRFSQKDILWIKCLRSMIHTKKLSIPGLRKLLQIVPCWMAASCPVEIQCHCPAQVDWSQPSRLELVGGGASAQPQQDIRQSPPTEQAACCIRQVGGP